MIKTVSVLLAAALAVACSKSASVDPSVDILGTWNCSDEIVVVLKADGNYEWKVPPGGAQFPLGGNEFLRTNRDGSYVILGKWRLSGETLELDMLGEWDKYSLAFRSPNAITMNGPETYSCVKP
jgi:hypothetical protein